MAARIRPTARNPLSNKDTYLCFLTYYQQGKCQAFGPTPLPSRLNSVLSVTDITTKTKHLFPSYELMGGIPAISGFS